MKSILFLSLLFGLNGCAGHATFETKNTTGKIIAKKYNNDESVGTGMMMVPFYSNGVYLPLSIPVPVVSPGTFIYSINTYNGELILTQSSGEFFIGDCVRLWHPPLAKVEKKEYNFVAGTLESSDECT
ncbi:hypothetical protein [Kaarinaea lacus]